ncbi:MAG: DUF1461 domain-containing protein [archaeon]
MKRLELVVSTLMEIFLMVVIVLIPLRLTLFNEDYYHSQFEKNKVYSDVENADEVLHNLLNFFRGKEELVYFEEDEQLHLEDVRSLLNKFFFALYFSVFMTFLLVVALFFLFTEDFRTDVFKIFFLAGLSSFALIALLFLVSLNFSMTFEGFHLLFFPQGNYTFAETSLLITMFPAVFFKSFFTKLLLGSVIISFIAMAPQIIKNKRKK